MRKRRSPPLHATLHRAAFALAFCSLCAFAAATPASAQITLSISAPSSSYAYEGPLYIAVRATSPSEVTSVQAATGTRTTALVWTPDIGYWTGEMPLDGLTHGEHPLVVTATNAAGQTESATRTFTYDKPPTLTVTSPAAYGLGQPDVRLIASCVDDGGSCRITVRTTFSIAIYAVGDGAIDTFIRPPDGLHTIEIAASDSTGRFVRTDRKVLVTSNNRLTPQAGYAGAILDVSTDRVLISNELASPATLSIVNRTTLESHTIWTATATEEAVPFGRLTPLGALFTVRRKNTILFSLREWRGGTTIDLAQNNTFLFTVNGGWALYGEYHPTQPPLILRNLLTGANTIVDADAASLYNDVTADGRVFFWDHPSPGPGPSQIYEYVPGPPPVRTQLTAHATERSVNPVTDGVNVVFTRFRDPGPIASLILRTGDGTETVLWTDSGGGFFSGPGQHYRAAGGWVAFLRPNDGGDSAEVWLRAPDGTERQLAAARKATLEGLSDSGEVIFETERNSPVSSPIHRRYLARPDGTLVDLGEPAGHVHLIDNHWFVSEAGQLLAVAPETPTRAILAEGATGTFFTTDIAILNPNDHAVPVTIQYLREDAPEIEETRNLPALSRTTIHENDVPGLEGTSVSTVVTSPATSPVVVERLMTWDANGYGGHLGTSVDRPRPLWMFAEGAQGFFHTFFLIANSNAAEASVRFTFLVEQGTPVTHTLKVPAGGRETLYAGDIADLIHRSFATVIESDTPIVAERAMYFGDSPLWLGGHGSAGATETANKWFHAEGATGSLFDTFILLANPHAVEVIVNVYYVTDDGKTFGSVRILPPLSRTTINVKEESPELVNATFSVLVEPSWYPIVSERAMYWGTTGIGWREAHNSFGVTQSGVKWGLAEGRSGGSRGYRTYVLVSKTTSDPLELRATFIKEDGTKVDRRYSVTTGRFNIDTDEISELANANFSTILESTNGVPFNVESAIYWNANGVIWEGGGNTIATRLQ
jgi:hypothetical protein